MADIYKKLFEKVPVAIIEMDYSSMETLRDEINSKKADDIRAYLHKNLAKFKRMFQGVTIRQINPDALAFYGSSSAKTFLTAFVKSFTGRAVDILIEQFVAFFSGEKEFSGEMKCHQPRKQGRDVFLRVVTTGRSSADLSSVILTLQDITPWKKTERTLRKKAQMDGLTGLLNQAALIERLEHELIRVKRYGLELSCMMIDLDFFKVINDKFGHQKGDAILKRSSEMIRQCFRQIDIVGRYGGDEFIVLMPETSVRNAYYAAQRLQRIFAQELFRYRDVISFHITLSIGITGYTQGNQSIKDANDLITLADNEMYNCKKAGRNRISAVGI